MNRPSPSRVRVSGPLEVYAAGFREELSTLGYSARSAAGYLQLMAHLSRWLVEIGLAPGELTLPQAERFVQGRRDGSRVNRVQQRLHPSQRQTRSLSAFIDHLERIGASTPTVETSAVNTARPLPPARRLARLPRSHLNMPSTQPRPPPPTRDYADPDRRLGIIRASAYSRHRALVILSTRSRARMRGLMASACPPNSSRKHASG